MPFLPTQNKSAPKWMPHACDESPEQGLHESPWTAQIDAEMGVQAIFYNLAGARGPAFKMGRWDIPCNFSVPPSVDVKVWHLRLAASIGGGNGGK